MGDNYQQTFDHATGDFIIFFSDDDAFVPTMLERVQRVITERNTKMVVFDNAFYYHESFDEFNNSITKNSLLFFPYTGDASLVTSRHALEQFFARFGLVRVSKDPKHLHPFIGNIICHRSVYDKIKLKTPGLFPTVPVDIYPVAMILGLVGEYYHLNEPLLVWSRWSKNATTSSNLRGQELRQHLEKTLGGNTLDHVPLKFTLPHNCSQNSLLQARMDLSDAAEHMNIDWSSYFIANYEQLNYFTGVGVDTTSELEEFGVALAKQSSEVQDAVRASRVKYFARLKNKIRNELPWLKKKLVELFRKKDIEKPIIIEGAEASFSNFLESANYLEENLRKFSKSRVEER
jgi:hypothetical protein